MKKKNIEEEFQNLESLIKDNEQIPAKLRTSLLKQLEVVRKCSKPRKSNKSQGHNQNSGLLKPVVITAEMAAFAKWDPSELHSRVEVTKCICMYVKENNLQKPENRRIILLNSDLKKLLRHEGDEITYPHIQKYIGIHFVKPVVSEDIKKKKLEKKTEKEEKKKIAVDDKKKIVEKEEKKERKEKKPIRIQKPDEDDKDNEDDNDEE
ncbi:MAG: SWIB/MDM2 domain-containing protein [Cetobacterium sp.]